MHKQANIKVRTNIYIERERKRESVLTDMLVLKPLTHDWSVAGADIPAVTFITGQV